VNRFEILLCSKARAIIFSDPKECLARLISSAA